MFRATVNGYNVYGPAYGLNVYRNGNHFGGLTGYWQNRTDLDQLAAQINAGGSIPALIDALESLTAAMDNVLLHQGKHMTPADQQGREKLVVAAKAALAAASDAQDSYDLN